MSMIYERSAWKSAMLRLYRSCTHSLFLAQQSYHCRDTKSMQSFVRESSRLRLLFVAEKKEMSLETFTNNELRVALVKLKPAVKLFVHRRPQISHLSDPPCGFRHLDSVFDHPLFLVSSMHWSGIVFLTAHTMVYETLRSMKAGCA